MGRPRQYQDGGGGGREYVRHKTIPEYKMQHIYIYHICIYVMQVYVCAYTHIHTDTHVYTHIYAYVYVCMYVYMCVYTQNLFFIGSDIRC